MVKIPITVYVEMDTYQKFNEYCEKHGFNRSAVVRIAMLELLKNRGDK